MGAALSMLYSGAVEATAGTTVSGIVSSVTTICELQEGVDVTLYSLRQEFMKIQCAINAARRRHITDPDFHIWLASLIDAVFLGKYRYRIFNARNHPPMIESEGTSNYMVTSPFYRAAKRQRIIKNLIFGDEELKELNDTLKMLKNIDICAFMLIVNALPEMPERPLETYLHMDHNRLFGRDKEKDQVMNFLFKPSTENNVDILPVVGSNGIGKTSLVLHSLHDPNVHNHFSLRIYAEYPAIAYPIESYQINIFKWILKKCNSTIINDDENTLIAMVKQSLSSERFLLVLNGIALVDMAVWNDLWDCLRCGKKGSKVIVTNGCFTKDDDYEVIVALGTVKPITLGGLCEDDFMFFFKEHAFGGADPEDYPELEKIWRDIATQMNGSIWKAKIFGELLRDNLNAQFWSNFLQKGLSNLKKYQRGTDLFSVIRTAHRLLPARLNVETLVLRVLMGKTPNKELKSFRELMVLGPKHCTPVTDKQGKTYVEFYLTNHVFLDNCTSFIGKVYLN